ncbi:telomere repeats-binding bouquet formation protein 1 isoform X2 [Melanotaenia boesemani]|uniref:telomere repeats-binding bouquet formation protein 1 isoform X2 n=1 Tax=Melanotaenia boesemani TaxID=1250792 RepID=UPI001C03CA25|nr:telomere repeats-binding bouquet formation protein 1 isoform X2 [Melanotaenia boesemani]
MDKTTAVVSNNTTKTDLSLLLECLKFQMKCPDLQKQALLTIHSICEKEEANVDQLRELGGVAFVYNLSKSSIVHSDVKEAAFFTLGTLAEANVYCKNSLCKKELFADIAGLLTKEDTPLTQKRVSVYLLFVLVANNKSGQTLAQTTGCLDVLLDLFRTSFPFVKDFSFRAATQTYQLWASSSSALCSCVNNPQNEEGQHICAAAFPIIKSWLQQISLPCANIFQPICSLIAMTVANNTRVQECFSASGGLETLALALVRLSSAADTSVLSCQLSVIISKTLSACITDNTVLASSLAQYGMVFHLLTLLTSSHLDPDDRLSVLLSIGLCTEASNEHQSQLVQCGGLPLIITFLTEDTSEEVRKAATFILQTCRNATMCLGVPGVVTEQTGIEEPLTDIERFRRSAKEMCHRIDLLEKRQLKEIKEDRNPPNSTKSGGQASQSPALFQPPQTEKDIKTIQMLKNAQQGCNISVNMAEKENTSKMKKSNYRLNPWEEKTKKNEGDVRCSECKGGSPVSSHVWSLERGSESHSVNNQMFKHPFPVKQSKPKEVKRTDELWDCEKSRMENIPAEEHSVSHIRCAGCVLSFDDVTSRTFASLQSSCHNSCDMHRVLQGATEQFRMRHLNENKVSANTEMNLVRASAAESHKCSGNWTAGNGKISLPQQGWRKHDGILLTPLHRRAELPNNRISLTPLKRQHLHEDGYPTSELERRGKGNSGQYAGSKISTVHCSTEEAGLQQ